MKIVFTGGGSGGHFYPCVAVAQEVNAIAEERKLLSPQLYYIGPTPYDRKALYENGITFKQSPAGKMRVYSSFLNFFDIFKTAWGIIRTAWQLFVIYPDVVFSKGGHASFPTLVAARVLRVPVVIHDSDSMPGRVSVWSGKFARRVGIAFPEAASAFPEENVAVVGVPIRRELFTIAPEGGKEFFGLDRSSPTIVILGGSQGARRINDTVIDTLPRLVETYQIIHQTGSELFEEVQRTTKLVLEKSPMKHRYKIFDFLNPLALRMAAGAADIVISRAGSTSIFEIALWGLPSIVVPIPETISRDQRSNAFSYARSGAAIVIEENNLTSNVLLSEIQRLMGDEAKRRAMGEAAKVFSRPEAARTIAEELIAISRTHEPR